MLSFLTKTLHLCFSKHKLSPILPTELTSNSSTNSNCHDDPLDLTDDFFSSEDYDTDTTNTTTTTTTNTAPRPPDFSAVFASQRFFFSSPGPSNSIFDSKYPLPESETLISGGIPTSTYSPDPYVDFRRSMQEMVDSKGVQDVNNDWDWLHELLLCYLALNPKYTHKYIMDAFADLLVTLMSSSSSSSLETDTHLPESDGGFKMVGVNK